MSIINCIKDHHNDLLSIPKLSCIWYNLRDVLGCVEKGKFSSEHGVCFIGAEARRPMQGWMEWGAAGGPWICQARNIHWLNFGSTPRCFYRCSRGSAAQRSGGGVAIGLCRGGGSLKAVATLFFQMGGWRPPACKGVMERSQEIARDQGSVRVWPL